MHLFNTDKSLFFNMTLHRLLRNLGDQPLNPPYTRSHRRDECARFRRIVTRHWAVPRINSTQPIQPRIQHGLSRAAARGTTHRKPDKTDDFTLSALTFISHSHSIRRDHETYLS